MSNSENSPQPTIPPDASTPENAANTPRGVRSGLITTLIGFFIFVIGCRPSLFGLDRSPTIGFVQIAVFIVGLGIICLGGYTCLMALWRGKQRSIPADIGIRLVATGYLIAVFTGMADIFGFGTQRFPNIPYFGYWQARGVIIGELLIAIGFFLLVPKKPQDNSTADTIS